MVKRLNIPNTVHPNAVHPNTVHPNTTNQDIKSKCSKVVQTKSSWATTISPWRTSLPNLNRTRSPTATSCTASWFVAWNKKTIRSAWNQQVTACFFCLSFRQAFSNFYGDINPRVIECLVGGFNPSEKYPPTPADARGSALGNNTFDSCFGLQN